MELTHVEPKGVDREAGCNANPALGAVIWLALSCIVSNGLKLGA